MLPALPLYTCMNKADKSASNSLNPSIFEGLVTLCAPDAVCFSRHIPHASGRILAERFCVIGTLRSNFLLHKKMLPDLLLSREIQQHFQLYFRDDHDLFFASAMFQSKCPESKHNINKRKQEHHCRACDFCFICSFYTICFLLTRCISCSICSIRICSVRILILQKPFSR